MSATDSDALRQARLFHSANPEVGRRLSALAQRSRPRSVTAGQMIYEPAETADSVFLLIPARDQGGEPLVQIRLAQSGSKRALRFARVVNGDIFGEAELVSAGLDPRKGTRITSARALTPARIINVSWSDMIALFELDSAIRTRFLRLAARRLLDAVWAQHSQGHEDPDIVLADWLVEYAADLGVATSNRVSFPRRLSQAEIADELNVSRETISRRLKEWDRSGLVTTSAAGLEVVDYSRLVRIAGLHSGRDRAALARAVADIAGEIDRGDLIDARNIGADMLRYFPSSPELLHQMALAAARSGDREEALAILRGARLTADGDLQGLSDRISRALKNPFAPMERIAADDMVEEAFEDEDADRDDFDEVAAGRVLDRLSTDIPALEARLLKDQAFDQTDGKERRRLAEASFQAYAGIYRRNRDPYVGINAASMALAAGNVQEAQKLAKEIARLLSNNSGAYWDTATVAEALVVGGDREGGMAALRRAATAPDVTDSSRASTALQFRRLAPTLKLDTREVGECLGIKSVALVTGHMFRASEMDAETQAAAGKAVREQAESIFTRANVGRLYGALACGADIVIAEAAADLGIAFHAVLPFPISRFCELSVRTGDPEGSPGRWQERFDNVLGGAASLDIIDDELPLDRDLDGHFFYGFRFMAGVALLRAGTLQADCRLIAVTDGTGPKNMAGANRAMADWLAAGREIDHIDFPFPRRATAGRARGGSSFRPCVFLWDVAGSRADLEVIARRGISSDEGLHIVPRTSRVGRDGTCIVAPSLEEALRLAERCADPENSLRIICDFGPVLGGDLKPDARMIPRLKAGSDMPGFPTGRPIATLDFAAQALTQFGARLDVRAVGRAEEAKLSDANGIGRARRRSGLPVYRLALKENTHG